MKIVTAQVLLSLGFLAFAGVGIALGWSVWWSVASFVVAVCVLGGGRE